MAGAEEATFARTPMGADLAQGVDTLDLEQTITFTKYIRLVLPLDGYVFWCAATMVGPSALFGAAGFNRARFNQPPNTVVSAPTFVCKGSMHYATDVRQEEAETYAANRMIFTSEYEVNDLNTIAPGTLWIGTFDGRRFAFSSRSSWYKQADLWHYQGFAIYPDMETQIIDDFAGFDSVSVVVSNSLPAWLALNGYNPPWGFGNPSLTLFPSFLSPENFEPPFATVHIVPEGTRGLALAPLIGPTSSHSQLCSDRVRITLWGTRNFNALDFVDCVNQYSLNTGAFGLMNNPVMRDEKRTQAEIATIAMKKSIEYEISYQQSRMNTIARKIITSAIPNFYFSGGITPTPPTPNNGYVTEDGMTFYVTENGMTFYVQEN